MEVKKTPEADLQNKRTLFLQIGLIIALGVCIALFSWSQNEQVIDLMEGPTQSYDFDMSEITLEDATPPPPAVKPPTVYLSDFINIVKDDTKIEVDMNFDDFSTVDDFEPVVFAKKEEAVDEDIPVMHAEEAPSFQGKDINAFRQWCAENVVYPLIAQENGIQGRVNISFVVERNGSISNVRVIRGVDSELDKAAVSVVSKSPKWNPGKNRGKPVRFTYHMPIDFILYQ